MNNKIKNFKKKQNDCVHGMNKYISLYVIEVKNYTKNVLQLKFI